MKIIQFSDSFLPIMDGVGTVVYQYALNLGQLGHESYVVAPQTNTGYRGQYPFEIVDYVGLPLFRMKSYRIGTPVLDMHCQNRLNAIDADIVHVHSPFVAGHAGISYAKKHGCPIVGTFHSRYHDDFLQVTGIELLADVGVKYVVNFYEKCDEVWAVSRSSAETLRGYGYGGDIRVMPNGTDIPPMPEDAIRETIERFQIDDTPLLLFVGQMNWKKNIRRVLEACALLDCPFRLMLAGQGPHERDITAAARKLGIEDKVTLLGHIGDRDTLNALYSLSSLFLFPSLYDTFALVVREAAAMGTPSVMVRGSSAAEGIRDGVNGYLCQDNAEDLARVVSRALKNPAKNRAVGQKARETIPVPWSELTRRVVNRYEKLLR